MYVLETARVSTSVLNDGSILKVEQKASNGRGVVSLEGYYLGGAANIILISDNAKDAKEILTGTTNWTTTYGSDLTSANTYALERVAYSADGKPIYLSLLGQCLSDDCENATNSVMIHNNESHFNLHHFGLDHFHFLNR